MPAQLPNAKAATDLARATTGQATGWATRVEDALNLLAGAANDFGTAATRNVGAGEGDVPVLGEDGRLDDSLLPAVRALSQLTIAFARELPVDSERGQGIRYLWQAFRWAARPGSTLLFGDLEKTARDSETPRVTVDPGVAVDLDVPRGATIDDYRSFEIRFLRTPGSVGSKVVTFASDYSEIIVDATNGNRLTVQANPTESDMRRRLVFVSAPPAGGVNLPIGYDLLSVEGRNPETGLANVAAVTDQIAEAVGQGVSLRLARSVLNIDVEGPEPAAINLTREQFDSNFHFAVQPGTVAPVAAPGREIILRLPAGAVGLFCVNNGTAVDMRVFPSGSGSGPAIRDRIPALLYSDGRAVLRLPRRGGTDHPGLVQLADADALAAGTVGRVVDAAALQAGLATKANRTAPRFDGTPSWEGHSGLVAAWPDTDGVTVADVRRMIADAAVP